MILGYIQLLSYARSCGRNVANLKFCGRNVATTAACSCNALAMADKRARCYDILELEANCDKQQLKERYLALAKKYHPDSNSQNADGNAERFAEISEAYKYIVQTDYSEKEQHELESVVKEFDIHHVAPQHRQYLEYGGVGVGTPSQRLREYQRHRVDQEMVLASSKVTNYITEKLTASHGEHGELIHSKQEANYARKWRTRNAIERLVEDLILESMRRGEFDNLPGSGKPIKEFASHNPYLDVHTYKLNQILIQNGFSPQWVTLEKEIKQERDRIRQLLVQKRSQLLANSISNSKWDIILANVEDDCVRLNKQIDHFNLICPVLFKQMVRFQLANELNKIEKSQPLVPVPSQASTTVASSSSTSYEEGQGVFKTLVRFLKRA